VRLGIRYLMDYRYESPVEDNLNALRISPATNANQRCHDFSLRVEPPARMNRHRDYFGTEVIELAVATAHDHLTIEAEARVSTSEPPAFEACGWSALAADSYREAGAEFLLDGGNVTSQHPFEELLASTRAESPLATLERLVEVIPDRFEYQPGSTYVGSTVDDLLTGGAGVCQDFVHLSLMLLRRHGIAARYVSGYLFAAPEGDGAESVEVATHAWVEAFLPAPEEGGEPVWVGADPTNRRLTGEQHAKIGHGRHYGDLPPIKGVYRGAARSSSEAKVTITRLDDEEGEPPAA
jgi:transglutaminase-like putative cysteine protease